LLKSQILFTNSLEKNVQFVWGGKDQQDAFDKLKHLFTSASILRNPDSNKLFIVEIDASTFSCWSCTISRI